MNWTDKKYKLLQNHTFPSLKLSTLSCGISLSKEKHYLFYKWPLQKIYLTHITFYQYSSLFPLELQEYIINIWVSLPVSEFKPKSTHLHLQ